MISVRYAAVYKQHTVSDAEYDLVHELYNMTDPHKVTAIRFLRLQHNLGLKESKDICDAIGAVPRVKAPDHFYTSMEDSTNY